MRDRFSSSVGVCNHRHSDSETSEIAWLVPHAVRRDNRRKNIPKLRVEQVICREGSSTVPTGRDARDFRRKLMPENSTVGLLDIKGKKSEDKIVRAQK